MNYNGVPDTPVEWIGVTVVVLSVASLVWGMCFEFALPRFVRLRKWIRKPRVRDRHRGWFAWNFLPRRKPHLSEWEQARERQRQLRLEDMADWDRRYAELEPPVDIDGQEISPITVRVIESIPVAPKPSLVRQGARRELEREERVEAFFDARSRRSGNAAMEELYAQGLISGSELARWWGHTI